MGRILLIDDSVPVRLTLEEGKTGRAIVRGPFGKVDVPTENKRIYRRALMEREINRLSEAMKRRRAFGELDHPADGKTQLKRCSHIITDLKIEDDGTIVGEAEILPTPNGNILKTLLQSGCEIGVSSRGFGSTVPKADGSGEEVADDYKLKTFDFVADPAAKGAYPELFSEDIDDDEEDLVEKLKVEFPDLVKELEESIRSEFASKAIEDAKAGVEESIKKAVEAKEAELKEQFAKNLTEAIAGLREDVEKEVRASLLESGQDARAVLEHVASIVQDFYMKPDDNAVKDALKAKEKKIAETEAERDEAVGLLNKAVLKLAIERKISGHPMADTIRKLIDVSESDTLENVMQRLDKVLEELPADIVNSKDMVEDIEAEKYIDELEHEKDALTQEVSSLKKRIKELERKLERAVDIGEQLDKRARMAEERAEGLEEEINKLQLENYKSESLRGVTNVGELRVLLEGAETKEEVDDIVNRYRKSQISDAELRIMRSKLAKGVGSRAKTIEEDHDSVNRESVLFGESISTLQALAGIKSD